MSTTEPVNAEQKVKKEKKVRLNKKGEPIDVKKEIMSWILMLLAAVVIAVLIRTLVFEFIRVDGGSMNNTLIDGEIVFVTKFDYLSGNYQRGDAVLCRYPARNTENTLHLGAGLEMKLVSHTLFVKRLVALPGDSVAVMNGTLYVNDVPQTEAYVDYPPTYAYSRRVLGENEYFVLGDNRAVSHDSHSSDVGPISKDMIVGHIRTVLWPLSAIRGVE